MDAVTDERVKMFPARYAKGYLDWLGEKRDWPVSRQLWWGHRIPVWTRTIDTEQNRRSAWRNYVRIHVSNPTWWRFKRT